MMQILGGEKLPEWFVFKLPYTGKYSEEKEMACLFMPMI